VTSEPVYGEKPVPHVVMLVANDLAIDTRVRKIAHDVAASGPKVTVLGISATDNRVELKLELADITLLPVGRLLRENTHRDPLLRTSASAAVELAIRADRQEFFNHQRDVGARIGQRRRRYFASRSARLHRDSERTSAAKATNGTNLASRLRIHLERRVNSIRKRGLHRWFLIGEGWIRRRLSWSYRLHLHRQETLKRRLLNSHAVESRDADWRTIHPELHDYEDAFGPELDRLAPDVIHAHDVHLLGVAARAVGRRHVTADPPILIYDSHEFVPGLAKDSKRDVAGWASLESEYINRADRVVTVSAMMAERIAEHHGLRDLPVVVMNVPIVVNEPIDSLRDVLGLADEVPIVVYSGGVTPLRLVDTLAEAMGQIEDAHLALVTSHDRYTAEIEAIAERHGYTDRLHIVPYVDPRDVVSFLRSATVGVYPYSSRPISHRVTLTNKVFEYMHAGLPVVVSDCPATAQLVEELGVGEVFEAGDAEGLANALKRILLDPSPYLTAYATKARLIDEKYSWRAQREVLLASYRSFLGPDHVADVLGKPKLPPLRSAVPTPTSE